MTIASILPAAQSDAEIDAPRKRSVDREHCLQKHIKLFVSDAVDCPHEFFAFDRSKKASQFTHMREKARGMRKGTPDTLLEAKGIIPIWCELKAPGNKPDADQNEMGRRLLAIGRFWTWATSVEQYRQYLAGCGVPLRRNAVLIAADHDARVAGEIMRAEAKVGKPRAVVRKPRASQSAIKRWNTGLLGRMGR